MTTDAQLLELTAGDLLGPLVECRSADEVAALLRVQGVRGRRLSGDSCPVARFLLRSLAAVGRPNWYVRVGEHGRVKIYDERLYLVDGFSIPKAVRDFIALFDEGRRFPGLVE